MGEPGLQKYRDITLNCDSVQQEIILSCLKRTACKDVWEQSSNVCRTQGQERTFTVKQHASSGKIDYTIEKWIRNRHLWKSEGNTLRNAWTDGSVRFCYLHLIQLIIKHSLS